MPAFLRLLLVCSLCVGVAFAQLAVSPRGALNGITFARAPSAVAAGGILTIFTTEDLGTGDAAVEGGQPLAAELGDPPLSVTVNGTPCLLYSIFDQGRQINCLVAYETEAGLADVVVTRGGVASDPVVIQVRNAQTSVFSFPVNQAVAIHGDGSVVVEGNPPAAGEALIAYTTGNGPVANQPAAGQPAVVDPLATTNRTQYVFAGGIPVTIAFSGLAPPFVGLTQNNLVWPEGAQVGDTLMWYSGRAGAGARGNITRMGGRSTPLTYFVDLPEGAGETQRVTLTDLSPSWVALTGPLAEDFCYQGVFILDARRGTTTQPEGCMFPINPLAANQNALRPFAIVRNRPLLGALMEGSGEVGDAVTNRMRLFNAGTGTIEDVDIPPTDRLRPGGGGGVGASGLGSPGGQLFQMDTAPSLRLDRPGETTETAVYNPDSGEITVNTGNTPLPDPLEVGPLTRRVGQNFGFGGGFRGRMLAPPAAAASSEGGGASQAVAGAEVVLFGPDGMVVAQTGFPEGWQPLLPSRRRNNQGNEVGPQAFAQLARGFDGVDTVYVLATTPDVSQDALVSFSFTLPEEAALGVQQTVPVESAVIPLPAGHTAVSCVPQIRLIRFPAARKIALITSTTPSRAFVPECGGDSLTVFEPSTGEIQAIGAPGMMDVNQRHVVAGYLYASDIARVPIQGPTPRLFVWDSFGDSISTIEFPDGLGVNVPANTVQRHDELASMIVTATAPEPANMRGIPIPGNAGLMVIDLANSSARRLALPEGFQRVLPTGRFSGQGSPPFGLALASGKVIARLNRVALGEGMPGGHQFVVWDFFSGAATPIPNPEGVMFLATAPGGVGGNPATLFDFNPFSGAVAAMGFDAMSQPVGVVIVAP